MLNSTTLTVLSPRPTNLSELCELAAQLFTDPFFTIAQWIMIVFGVPMLALFVHLIRTYRSERMHFHSNLALLMAHIVLFSFMNSFTLWIVSLRYEIIKLFFSADPCNWLTPVWLAALYRIPGYAYIVTVPMLHLGIMVERYRATLRARQYEREGLAFSIGAVLIVWLICVVYALFVLFSALADTELFGRPLILITLTSRYNSNVIICTYYVAFGQIVVTIVGDYLITRTNQTMKTHVPDHNNYSLSRIYQIRENIVTMGLILPLDISYSGILAIYMLGTAVLRSMSAQISMSTFLNCYETLNMLLSIYFIVTLCIYICFIKNVAKARAERVKIKPMEEQAHLYFAQLNSQWN